MLEFWSCLVFGLDIECVSKCMTLVNVVGADEDDLNMPPIIGQIDLIEDGYISGWACEKGIQQKALQVKIFINDALMGSVTTRGRALHPLVDRICAGPANIGTDGENIRNVAFKYRLPQLKEGLYTARTKIFSLGLTGVFCS